MGSASVQSAVAGLIGRDRERKQIERLLEAAGRGEGGALVITGDAGIGKSALLEDAAARARAMTVLRTTGVEGESDLAFAGLYGLLRPILDKLDRLGEPQAQALAGALGLAASPTPDRFLASAAALGLLAAAAEDRPILCIVDDAQWLDRPSAEALVFAARRLAADSVAMLFAAAATDEARFDARGLPALFLSGIDELSAARILDLGAPNATPTARKQLLAEAAGNPLALLELPGALSEDQLTGRLPFPETIPLTPRLRGVFQRRVDRLPESARRMMLICALDSTGGLAVVLRAAADLCLRSDELDPAEAAGLIRTHGGRIAFQHPLIRSAVHDAAPLSQRQQVHLALASALWDEDQLDRRVWHQAAAALTGDEEVAAALEASGRRARQRAGYASAASAFERAAELTRDKSRLAPRLTDAAEAAWDAGQLGRARDLVIRVLRLADESQRARLLHLRGSIETREGRMRDAAASLLDAADASSDPSLTLEILLDAIEPLGEVADTQELDDHGARARQLVAVVPARTPLDAFNKAAVLWFWTRVARQYEDASRAFEDVMGTAAAVEDDSKAQFYAANVASLGSISVPGCNSRTVPSNSPASKGCSVSCQQCSNGRQWSFTGTVVTTLPTPLLVRDIDSQTILATTASGI